MNKKINKILENVIKLYVSKQNNYYTLLLTYYSKSDDLNVYAVIRERRDSYIIYPKVVSIKE